MDQNVIAAIMAGLLSSSVSVRVCVCVFVRCAHLASIVHKRHTRTKRNNI